MWDAAKLMHGRSIYICRSISKYTVTLFCVYTANTVSLGQFYALIVFLLYYNIVYSVNNNNCNNSYFLFILHNSIR